MARPEMGDQALDVTLFDRDGEKMLLSSRWRDRPLVAAFLRHFG
jgi:hypothetical protein